MSCDRPPDGGQGPPRPPLGRPAGRQPAGVDPVPRRARAPERADPPRGARRRRRLRDVAGVEVAPEVAQRPPRRRGQAGRDPRRAQRRRVASSSAWASTSGGRPRVRRAWATASTPVDVLVALLAAYDRLPADVTDAYRAALRHARPAGPRGAARRASSRARRPASRPTAASSSSTPAALTHRLAAGDVVHLRTA